MPLFKGKHRGAGQTARVVICDDQPEVRVMYRRLLDRDKRFEVVAEATNGQEAIDSVEEHSPDAILLDFGMPGKTGVEALRAIRETSPETKVIVVTSFFNMGEEAIEMGAHAFVSKSLSPKEMVRAVSDTLWGNDKS